MVAAATLDDADGSLTLFVANRSTGAAVPLGLEPAGALTGYRVTGHRVLRGADPDLRNTADRPDAVQPVEVPAGDPVRLEPVTWNVLRCSRAAD